MSLYDAINAAQREIDKWEKEVKAAQNALNMSGSPSKIKRWGETLDNRKQRLFTAQLNHKTLKDQQTALSVVREMTNLGSGLLASEVLEKALGHMKDRAKTYDKPDGERSIPKVIELFNIIRGRDLTAEEGWLIMLLLKVVRANQGEFKADNFEDLAAYAALYGEEASRENHK